MLKIDFPKNRVQVRTVAGNMEAFDPIRKKWVHLSPEEWVRQHIIQYLLEARYPASLMAVEKQIRVGALTKRGDVVVYRRDLIPFMIVECKKTEVPLTVRTLEQILRYHIAIPATFLLVTNGQYSFCFEKIESEFIERQDLPPFPG